MRLLALLSFLLFAPPNWAQDPVSADPVRWNGHVVTVGDSAQRLIELLGAPMRRVEVEDRSDGHIEERWTYADPQDANRSLILRLRSDRLLSVQAVSLPE